MISRKTIFKNLDFDLTLSKYFDSNPNLLERVTPRNSNHHIPVLLVVYPKCVHKFVNFKKKYTKNKKKNLGTHRCCPLTALVNWENLTALLSVADKRETTVDRVDFDVISFNASPRCEVNTSRKSILKRSSRLTGEQYLSAHLLHRNECFLIQRRGQHDRNNSRVPNSPVANDSVSFFVDFYSDQIAEIMVDSTFEIYLWRGLRVRVFTLRINFSFGGRNKNMYL